MKVFGAYRKLLTRQMCFVYQVCDDSLLDTMYLYNIVALPTS